MRHLFASGLLFLAGLATGQSDYYIRFPDDLHITDCSTPLLTPPQPGHTNGANITFDYEDATYTVVPDACVKIERRWYVRSANYDPSKPCTYVPNPQPLAVTWSPANLPGPIVSPSGTPAPWEPTMSKINASDPAPTNFSTYWSDTANCYIYTQIIRLLDLQPPAMLDCPASMLFLSDSTTNDPQLWNATYWSDPVLQTHDLSETSVALHISATDSCSLNNLTIYYLLFLDTDQDGLMETVINSNNLPAAGQVNFNNLFNPNFGGGTPRDFDQRMVDAGQRYRFGLRVVSNGNVSTASVGWNTTQGPSNWVQPQLPPGTHKIKWYIEDNCGNQSVCEYTFQVLPNPATVHVLRGQIRTDESMDCQADPNEPVLQNCKVRLNRLNAGGAIVKSAFSSVRADGYYNFEVDTGRYELLALAPNWNFSICLDTLLNINTFGDTSLIDFPMRVIWDCPYLETDIGIDRLRRCVDNTYVVRYCNNGTMDAENAFIRVKLDPFMSFVSASQPAVEEGEQVWRFDLGTVAVNTCGFFTLVAHLDCDSTVIGQTHCVEAHIYPDSICLLPAGWSGANVDVEGACNPDSVRFVLRNIGQAPTSMLEYIVIEDNIITRQATYQLPAGDSMLISVPSNGSTWRLESEQEPGNPYHPMPSATVEACGENQSGGISLHFLSQFGEDDRDPFVSIDCQESRGSFDPNDKTGYPLGYSPAHLIEAGQPLDYLIRFQNTGTDTAFTVVVVDTLASWLDPASVTPGASSQPYSFDLSGPGILTFRFENILLPDSNVNEAASHGFVKFRVNQRSALAPGTVIPNRAAIYFDFNEPVFTNETWHQIGEHLVTTALREARQRGARLLTVSPNPVSRNGQIYFDRPVPENARFDLYDARGKLGMSEVIAGARVQLAGRDFSAGLYFFRVSEDGKLWGIGKLQITGP